MCSDECATTVAKRPRDGKRHDTSNLTGRTRAGTPATNGAPALGVGERPALGEASAKTEPALGSSDDITPYRRPELRDVPTATRQRVRKRDRRCRYCGTYDDLDVHHISYRSQGLDHQDHNLIVLCRTHHDIVHGNKALWQPVLRAYIWLYYVEQRQMFLLDLKRRLAADEVGTDTSRRC